MAEPGHAFCLASLSFEIIALVRTSLRHKYRLCSVLTHLFFLRNHRPASNSTLIDFTGAVRRLCESSIYIYISERDAVGVEGVIISVLGPGVWTPDLGWEGLDILTLKPFWCQSRLGDRLAQKWSQITSWDHFS